VVVGIDRESEKFSLASVDNRSKKLLNPVGGPE